MPADDDGAGTFEIFIFENDAAIRAASSSAAVARLLCSPRNKSPKSRKASCSLAV
ncbi:unannotated protein [freshwater metagenome]|uniref:Unannotated protein n=1 Tax=freshwater metagenome TaxID=449393 RepID=A0A6J7TZC4_9ZZZZ